MRKEYHKLVRDRIPEIIEGEGEAFEVRVLDEAAYREALHRLGPKQDVTAPRGSGGKGELPDFEPSTQVCRHFARDPASDERAVESNGIVFSREETPGDERIDGLVDRGGSRESVAVSHLR